MTVEIRAFPYADYWKATLSFAEPTCPVCGAPATILSARFGQDEFKCDDDCWTVALSCSADQAHGVLDGEPREFVFVRPMYVFVSREVQRAAVPYLVHGTPDGSWAELVRDIGTGIARIVIQDGGGDWTVDDVAPLCSCDGPVGEAEFPDRWPSIPGHPEFLGFRLASHYASRDRDPAPCGEAARGDLRRLLGLDGTCPDDPYLTDEEMAGLEALPPEQQTAWADRWAGVPGAILTPEFVAHGEMENIAYWSERLYGYAFVFEGEDDCYAERLAESVAAGRGINPDGSIAGFPAPMEEN